MVCVILKAEKGRNVSALRRHQEKPVFFRQEEKMSKKIEDLQKYLEKMNRYNHVVTLLYWDMRTGMPKS